MKKITCSLVLILLFTISTNAQKYELANYLNNMPNIANIDTLESGVHFNEKYMVEVEQLIDSQNPEIGTFTQRVIISHKGFDKNTVMICEGYGASYALRKNYINELSAELKTNQICIEHRYFNSSTPENLDYQYLTTENAAADHHAIYEMFDSIYNQKWISTGVSKGGQTTILYSMYYPEDMDLAVPYVAPVSRAVEDLRHPDFIADIGTKADQKKIKNFQIELFKRKSEIMSLFIANAEIYNFEFNLPIEEIYDYCVLEFPFAFWQYIGNTSLIPEKDASNDELFYVFNVVSSSSYYAIDTSSSSIFPFFYQACRELGYYRYEPKDFIKYGCIESTENYLFKLFIPKDMEIEFMPETSQNIEAFLKTSAKDMIFIYGGNDPWTAAAPEFSENPNIYKYILENGTHSANINSFDKDIKKEIYKLIDTVLED